MPRAVARDIDRARLVIGNENPDVNAVFGHGGGELVAPFDQTYAPALEQAEEVDVSQLVFLVKPIEVEVQQRQLVADILEQDVEGGAGDVVIDAEAGGKTLCELRLACAQVATQHDAVVHLHEPGDLLAQPHGVLDGITSTVNQS